MKYLLLIATLFILAACQPVIDTRDPATAAATRTALASAPVPALPGVLRITLLTPPPIPTMIEPAVLPTEEVGEVVPDPVPEPPCVVVKANIGRTGKIYHLPGMANYEQVKIDEAAGEAFYCSEQEAVDAGFRRAAR